MMQSMLDTLNGFLGRHTDAHGDPSFALIPPTPADGVVLPARIRRVQAVPKNSVPVPEICP
jgi:hypothetical protein